MSTSEPRRCPWASDDLLAAYHDREWGVPVRDDRQLFELLVLEGAQAGLSWRTVLAKREAYRAAFDFFEPAAVARFGEAEVAALLANPGIVRHRRKIESAVANARALVGLAERHGSFARYLWGYVEDRPVVHSYATMAEVPASTELSRALSTSLRSAGMNFVGPTICYAFLQAAGVVMDHLTTCPRWKDLRG